MCNGMGCKYERRSGDCSWGGGMPFPKDAACNDESEPMDFNYYQNKAVTTDQYEDDRECALGLASEAGELAGKISKAYLDGNGRDDLIGNIDIAYEIGDTLWYLAAIADRYGFSLQAIAAGNLLKLASRKERGKIGGSGDYR